MKSVNSIDLVGDDYNRSCLCIYRQHDIALRLIHD
jgi:hypothetical protein